MPNDTEKKVLTQADLNHFTGSTEFYKHWLGGQYTEGVLYMADTGGAHWLIDAVYSYQCQKEVKAEEFQLWELKVVNQTAILTMKRDTNEPEIVQQEIPYTDFPLDYIRLYHIDGKSVV